MTGGLRTHRTGCRFEPKVTVQLSANGTLQGDYGCYLSLLIDGDLAIAGRD